MTHAYGYFMGLAKDFAGPYMGPVSACTAIEDFTCETVHQHNPAVLWGAPIISKPGDFQPLEVVHMMSPKASRWGKGFARWMRDNFTQTYAIYTQTANIPTTETYVDLDPHVRDPFGQPALRITHQWGEADQRSIEFLYTKKRQIAREMGMTDWWEEPSAPLTHLSTHEVGTHRMGEDPARSVVDMFGRSHECENLLVVGGGQFPATAVTTRRKL